MSFLTRQDHRHLGAAGEAVAEEVEVAGGEVEEAVPRLVDRI